MSWITDIATGKWSVIDNGILIIFAIDYFARLILAKDKRSFIKNNIFDLLSIIPVNGVFAFYRINRIGRLFRLLKFVRFLRLTRLIGLIGRLESFLKMHGLIYYFYLAITILLITSSIYSLAENVSFSTALWWSITTATTVGYGDISPHTGLGKISAVLDMLIGIGFIGMLTSSLTDVFYQKDNYNLKAEISRLHQENQQWLSKLDKLEKEIKSTH